jgi:hypothetical protein
MIPIFTGYVAYQNYKTFKEIEEGRKETASSPKTNEEIAEILFNEERFKKLFTDYYIRQKSVEKEIRSELKKRKFDFKKSNIELEFQKTKWIGYKIKNYVE